MADAQGAGPSVAEWTELSGALLRGLVHTLNNRLTALSAFAELAGMGDEESTASRVMPAELERLHRLSAMLRLLALERTPPEALEPIPLADEALALYAHHPDARGVRHEIARVGASMPVRAPRWALVRLTLLLLDAGRRAAQSAGRDTALLRITSDAQAVTLDAGGVALPAEALAMARLCGATADADVAGGVVRLPSLLATRRRERGEA